MRRLGIACVVASAAIATSACLWMLPSNPKPSAKDVARDQTQRAASQATLESYQAALKPGTSRKEVDEYLRQQKTIFERRGGMQGYPVPMYLITVGRLWKPWYCSEHYLKIWFYFSRLNPRADVPPGALDSDVLTKIEMEEKLDGCL